MSTYIGMDLHSNNVMVAAVNSAGKRVHAKRIPNDLPLVCNYLERYSDIEMITVESTFNWYWLVDGLQDYGYAVCLANPAAVDSYEGTKNADDKHDAFWLAELLKLGILKTGYIYPREYRPIRDLARRRMSLVSTRTKHLLSLQSLTARYTGKQMRGRDLLKMSPQDFQAITDSQEEVHWIGSQLELIGLIDRQVGDLEQQLLQKAEGKTAYQCLRTVPGIGPVLGLVIALETGSITRFATPGKFVSYCRCTKAIKTSNGKKKGRNNSKNGNKYLSWAFVEAVHHLIRLCPQANSYYQKKKAKKNGALATKSLAAKLVKACYFMMRDNSAFDVKKMFG